MCDTPSSNNNNNKVNKLTIAITNKTSHKNKYGAYKNRVVKD